MKSYLKLYGKATDKRGRFSQWDYFDEEDFVPRQSLRGDTSTNGRLCFREDFIFLNGTITDQSISSDPDIRLRTIMRVYCKNYELDEK